MPQNRPVPTPHEQPQAFLQHLYRVAVHSAQPLHGMRAHLPALPSPASGGRTVVLGAGKAGGAMAQALEALWPADAPLSGLVVTRYGHVPPRPPGLAQRIEVVQAGHPLPDAAGHQAAARMLALAQGLSAHDLVLCLISGGGSALLSLPAAGLALREKQRITGALLDSGASISEINCVRKHLSRIKGGHLGAACWPAQVVTLAISDIPGDDVATIASGPTVPDASTCADALAILAHRAIALPPALRRALESGTLETPKPGDARFAKHTLHLLATPQQSLQAAARAAQTAGLHAHILSDAIEGESREVAKVHAALARAVAQRGQPFARPCVLLSGGETTVTVRTNDTGQPKGQGGRATEFCLALARALQGQAGVWALAADTDGIDGVGENAGAQIAPDTLARAQAQRLDPDAHLHRHDSCGFFAPLGDLVHTGPTYTNVNDFRAILIL